jgi:hypothetical protein
MQERKESGEDMQTDEEGTLCPKAQLIRDLSELRNSADDSKAEIIIAGDFTGSWKSRGLLRKWGEEESRLTNIFRSVKEQEVIKPATQRLTIHGQTVTGSWPQTGCVERERFSQQSADREMELTARYSSQSTRRKGWESGSKRS